MAGAAGLEPVTSAVTGQRSNQLSYAPAKGDGTVGKRLPMVKPRGGNIRAADAKEVGVGNPAEETCCYPNGCSIMGRPLFCQSHSGGKLAKVADPHHNWHAITRSTNAAPSLNLPSMAFDSTEPLDRLWKEYGLAFHEFDDLTLSRWMAQTLGQLQGKAWRLSHPLLGAYRLAAQVGHDRQIWHKRLATPPSAYPESACCRAPLLPLFTRDVRESGLICQHCNETLVPFEEISAEVRPDLEVWAAQYEPIHAVAHWDDHQRKAAGNYDRAYENAALEAERLLGRAATQIAAKLLDLYPAIVWEDHDECLEVRPEDIAV